MHEDPVTHGEFIYPSYALTVAGLIGAVVWSFVAMRAAEGAAERTKRRGDPAMKEPRW